MSQEQNSALQAMLSQYETATSYSNESSFDANNYFTTHLPEGIDSKMFTIRILPNDGKSPFEEVYFNSAKVDGKNRKFVNLRRLNDEPCPFSEARETLLATGDKQDEEIAKKYKERLMYIVKVIDRENEDHGPKFWRFPVNYKKEGILDKIMATIGMLQEDITNPESGRDLVLNVVRVKNPRGGTYPMVNSIIAKDKSELSPDTELSIKWVNDEKTWRDVYSVKSYDYLKLIVAGKVPAWSKKLEKFVDKATITDEDNESTTESLDAQLNNTESVVIGQNTSPAEPVSENVEAPVAENTYKAPVDVEEEEGDDLPF